MRRRLSINWSDETVQPKNDSTFAIVACCSAGGPACSVPSGTNTGQYSWKYAPDHFDALETGTGSLKPGNGSPRRKSALVLACGNGSPGFGTPRNPHSGSQPSTTS